MTTHNRMPTIDRSASSGVLWGLMAWHVNRLADRAADDADRKRSTVIADLARAELAFRHGNSAVIAARPAQ